MIMALMSDSASYPLSYSDRQKKAYDILTEPLINWNHKTSHKVLAWMRRRGKGFQPLPGGSGISFRRFQSEVRHPASSQ